MASDGTIGRDLDRDLGRDIDRDLGRDIDRDLGRDIDRDGTLERGAVRAARRAAPGLHRRGPWPRAPRLGASQRRGLDQGRDAAPLCGVLTIPLPADLLDRVRSAARAEGGGRPRDRFGPLEAAVHAWVYGCLPARARRVRLAWDEEAAVVVARFELASDAD